MLTKRMTWPLQRQSSIDQGECALIEHCDGVLIRRTNGEVVASLAVVMTPGKGCGDEWHAKSESKRGVAMHLAG